MDEIKPVTNLFAPPQEVETAPRKYMGLLDWMHGQKNRQRAFKLKSWKCNHWNGKEALRFREASVEQSLCGVKPYFGWRRRYRGKTRSFDVRNRRFDNCYVVHGRVHIELAEIPIMITMEHHNSHNQLSYYQRASCHQPFNNGSQARRYPTRLPHAGTNLQVSLGYREASFSSSYLPQNFPAPPAKFISYYKREHTRQESSIRSRLLFRY